MELKHLYTFLTLSEIKNFTKTAEFLHYAQSNVTTHIQQLEKELHTQLFERMGKSVTLTASGLELVPYAQKMLNLSKEIEMKFSNNTLGRITIGASESICIYCLPSIIEKFKMTHPNIELYLQVLDTADFIPLIANNTIDIAFILDKPIEHPNICTALSVNETISAFALPHHPLAKKSKVTIEDFANQPMILTSKDCCYRKMFENDLSKTSIRPKIVLETSSLQVIKQAVLSDLGICLLPQLAMQKEVASGQLVEIDYETDYQIVSQLIYHKDKWLSQNIKSLIDTIKDTIG